ncbi:pre-rRNA-processing protein TSR2-like [Silene latifolia]|uniref:pre-rRNA-processing protein TSR2-like n=1 Tax=Silene latifolia TaxID=37657 RepID=UPI003D78A085
MKLTGASAQQMEQGILLVFKRWRELRDAVDGSFGGPHSGQKASHFADDIINFFTKPNGRESPSIDELLDLLDDGMDDLGLVEVESVNEVANILMNMYEECLDHNYQRIQELRDTAQFFDNKTAPNPFPREAASISSDGVAEDNEGSSMIANSSESLPNQESASQAMELDEAPWITVASKKPKSRKN